MKKGIGLGIDDFRKIIKEDCYYFDKTNWIEELLKDTKVREQLNLPLNSSFYFKVRNKQIHIETTDILAAYPVSDGDYIEIEDVS